MSTTPATVWKMPQSPAYTSSDCDRLATPDPFAFSLSTFLLIGILISYIPQHAKIVTARSSLGLSPYWVLLGSLSAIAGFANILILPNSRDDMRCCSKISGFACAAALLGVVQVGLVWACFMTILVLFLIFLPRNIDPSIQNITVSEADGEDDKDYIPSPRTATFVGLSAVVTLLGVLLTSLALIFRSPRELQAWANILGIMATVCSSVQYLPQLYTTYHLGKIMSLSITTMLIQVPGAFLFAFSLWLRVGWEGWSTWIVYCFTGVLQGILLIMAIGFIIRDRKGTSPPVNGVGAAQIESPSAAPPNERSALLANDDRDVSRGRTDGR